jgi:hypothetical protein
MLIDNCVIVESWCRKAAIQHDTVLLQTRTFHGKAFPETGSELILKLLCTHNAHCSCCTNDGCTTTM